MILIKLKINIDINLYAHLLCGSTPTLDMF